MPLGMSWLRSLVLGPPPKPPSMLHADPRAPDTQIARWSLENLMFISGKSPLLATAILALRKDRKCREFL
jgi:hypothetical protein